MPGRTVRFSYEDSNNYYGVTDSAFVDVQGDHYHYDHSSHISSKDSNNYQESTSNYVRGDQYNVYPRRGPPRRNNGPEARPSDLVLEESDGVMEWTNVPRQSENTAGIMVQSGQSATSFFLATSSALQLMDRVDRHAKQDEAALVHEQRSFTELTIYHQVLSTIFNATLLARILVYVWTSYTGRSRSP